MATTYLSDKAAASVPARTPPPGGSVTVVAKATITAAIVVNDLFKMVKVPPGAVVTGVIAQVPDVDTDATPVAAYTVGDDLDTDRYITTTLAGVANTLTYMNGLTALVDTSVYVDTNGVENTVDILWTVAPDTSVTTGDVYLAVTYQMGR